MICCIICRREFASFEAWLAHLADGCSRWIPKKLRAMVEAELQALWYRRGVALGLLVTILIIAAVYLFFG